MFTRRELIKLSSSATYSRAEAYWRQKRVKIIEDKDGRITANVRGSQPGNPYRVSIGLSANGDRLLDSECDCPAFEEYDGVCKHVVATILQAQNSSAGSNAGGRSASQKNEPPPPKKSDNAARLLLNTYLRTVTDQAREAHNGQITLEPVLEYDAWSAPSLFFRVGEKRMYIVPDLSVFKTRFENQISAEYGKNFSLWHSAASFCAESRPLVAFFLKNYDNNNYLYNTRGYGYYSSGNKRNMFLSPAMADAFFALLQGKKLTVRDDKRREATVPVRREDFRPHLRIQKTDGGVTLDLSGWFIALGGDNCMYVLTEDGVFCCGGEFKAACEDLLKLLKSSSGHLFFSQADAALLFSVVLPRVEPFAELEIEGDFEEYRPLPLETKIYLDSHDADSVTARMTFTYGDKTHDAYGQKDLAVSQDIAGEIAAEHMLADYFGNTVYEGGMLLIDKDADAVYRLVSEGLDELSGFSELYSTDSFGRVKIRPPVAIALGVRVDAGLLRLDFDLEGVDLSELPDILASYRLRKRYHRLRDGSFLALGETALENLSELADGLDLTDKQLSGGHAELASSRALYLDAICKRNGEMRLNRDRSFKQILRDMREVENADFPVPAGLRGVLRNYQKTGFRWLKTLDAYGFGGILADDMGLGKTIQILTMLESARKEAEAEAEGVLPSVVVCPSSLSLNWESEAQTFTPELRTLVIGGTPAERAAAIERAGEYDLVITSYDLLKRDIELYGPLRFRFVILDEAQYIKNQGTQNAKSVKALNGQVRFALTGTPVENSLAELWSIFDFLMPGYLFPYSRFKKKFEEPIVKSGDRDAQGRLRRLVQPFLLRRLKKDVLKELPPKTESVRRVSMEDEQKKLYLTHLASVNKEFREKAGLGAGQERIAILAALTRLRQICCDPALIYENYSGGSVKLEACMELVDSCIQAGRRILLFSQFTSMLDIIERRLKSRRVRPFRIDGATPPSRRLELVNTFNAGDAPVFLISLKAGGTGLNLTGADVVIHYDPWWNLSAQNQATDRAHRIGQLSSVQVYKLIVKDTVEERILKMQEKKAGLAGSIIEGNDNPFERLNREELLSLLDMK